MRSRVPGRSAFPRPGGERPTDAKKRDESGAKPELLRRLGRQPDPAGENHLVLITLDSCRYDTFQEAAPSNLASAFGGLGSIERRISYAPWTAPSHYNLLMGLLPHRSPRHVYASEYYKEDFVRYRERLGTGPERAIDFASLVPSLWLPTFLRYDLGYRTHAMVSMPVLNRATPINSDFNRYELMEDHNDMKRMLDRIEEGEVFTTERPTFLLMNAGETHFPYTIPGDDPEELPPLDGPHGILRPVDEDGGEDGDPGERRLDAAKLEKLREKQVRAMRYLDREVFPRLWDILPENTWVILTSDHGELFGEDGYFGHGPILHDKVLEVPFVEGKVR